MQKHEVDIVGFEFAHRFEYRFSRFVVSVMFHPDLCGKENLFAGNSRFRDCISYFFLVEVTLRRVDVAITDFQSVENATFAVFLVYLINPVSELRHFYAVS